MINQFSIATTGTYFIKLNGTLGAAYDAVFTRNAAFDTELNDSIGTAQSISGTQGVLGAISPSANEDWYSINVSSSASIISLSTRTPADGAGQFVNTLAPKIELYNSSNVLVASGTVASDGRNESLVYSAPALECTACACWPRAAPKGNTFLSTQFSPLSNVQSVTIDDATAQRSRVRSITIIFNGNITSASAAAFGLLRTEDNLVVPLIVSALTPLSGNRTQVTLTFSGSSCKAVRWPMDVMC